MERVTQKDERGYYLVGDGIYSDWGVPEKFRGDDVDRLAAIEDILGPDYDLDRLRALMEADRDGLVRIARRPPLESECCGNCGHFQRITGTARGDCAVREYTGKPWRGKFTPCQSRKACRQFQRRTEEHGRPDSEEGRDEAPAAGIPGNPAAGAGE